MEFFKSLTKFEKRLLGACAAILAICAFFLLDDGTFFGPHGGNNSGPTIGEVSSSKNDTRIKESAGLFWSKIATDQPVHGGDAVFTGRESQAQVHLKKGGVVDIGENSMVVFSDDNGTPMAKINFGKFKINSNGTVKLAINGQVTTIKSKSSNIEVTVNKNAKPEIHLVKGEAQIEEEKAPPVQLTEQKPTTQLQAPPVVAPPPPPAEVPDLLIPEAGAKTVSHYWRVDEIYDHSPDSLQERAEPSRTVLEPTVLNWSTTRPDDPRQVAVQISSNSQFQNAETVHAEGTSLTQQTVYVGDNFWRISRDGKKWSETQQFQVVSGFLRETPELILPTDDIQMVQGGVDVPVHVLGPSSATAYIYEQSPSKQFPKSETKLVWVTSNHFEIHLNHQGTSYYRVRGVSTDQSLTEWSGMKKITVSVPALPKAPSFKNREMESEVGNEVTLELNGPKNARRYQIEITDDKDQLIESREIDTPTTTWSNAYPGDYHVRAYAIDQWDRKSEPSKPAQIRLTPKTVAVADQDERTPSTSGSLTVVQPDSELSENRNHWLTHSYLEFSGVYSNYASSEQITNQDASATDIGLGLRYKGWWHDEGVEAVYSTAVSSPSNSGIKTEPKQLEVRYHHRFQFEVAQLSLFAGYDDYHNSSSTAYSSGANLIKLGADLQLPIFGNWAVEGEISYGFASDGSKQYDGLAQVDYFLTKQWSINLGLHLRLFEAGSLKSAPGTLPFREGSTDTVTSLRYYF